MPHNPVWRGGSAIIIVLRTRTLGHGDNNILARPSLGDRGLVAIPQHRFLHGQIVV